jgi:hypothetical protein
MYNLTFEVFYVSCSSSSFLLFPAQGTSLFFIASLDGQNDETCWLI